MSVWVPVDGVERHRRRDCPSIRGHRLDAIASTSPRADLFDPCPRCMPRERPRPRTALRRFPQHLAAWRIESMRAEAARRGVSFLDWAGRHRDVRVIDVAEPEVVIDLRDPQRQPSVSVTS
jgi:hypothetical protein